MPGLNGSGPEGMGPMTGGGRGYCNPRASASRGQGQWSGRGGRRGFRNIFRTTGIPGRGRFMAGGFSGYGQYGREDEIAFLKDRSSFLKNEITSIDSRLKELESEK